MYSFIESYIYPIWKHIPESSRELFTPKRLYSMVKDISDSLKTTLSLSEEECISKITHFMSIQQKIAKLVSIPLVPQKSDAWLSLRKNMLTASDLAQALGKGKFGSRNALLQKKAQALCRSVESNESTSMSTGVGSALPLKWGTMFEPMISRVYSQRNGNIPIYEFGLLPHPTLAHFGASPDGITEIGKMVEIKCPWRRKIEQGVVPEQYFLQIQGQLSVCELDECDYIEVIMMDIENEQQYYEAVAMDETKEHGVLLELQHPSGQESYEYSPIDLTPKQAYQWANQRAWEIIRDTPEINIMKIRPWKVLDSNTVTVTYDKELWETLIPQIEAFWTDVLEIKNKYEHTEVIVSQSPPKQRTIKKKATCMYRDEEEDTHSATSS